MASRGAALVTGGARRIGRGKVREDLQSPALGNERQEVTSEYHETPASLGGHGIREKQKGARVGGGNAHGAAGSGVGAAVQGTGANILTRMSVILIAVAVGTVGS